MKDLDDIARNQELSWSSIPGAPPPLPPDDPAQILLQDDYFSIPKEGVYDSKCFICTDPEFALMGLPLCRSCPACQEAGNGEGHVPADDVACTVCGFDEYEAHLAARQPEE